MFVLAYYQPQYYCLYLNPRLNQINYDLILVDIDATKRANHDY